MNCSAAADVPGAAAAAASAKPIHIQCLYFMLTS
jgi:hypothetical protein